MLNRLSMRSVHRGLVAATMVLSLAGFAFVSIAEACPEYRGCLEGCFCTWAGGPETGVCGYNASENACQCVYGGLGINTNDCKAPILE